MRRKDRIDQSRNGDFSLADVEMDNASEGQRKAESRSVIFDE